MGFWHQYIKYLVVVYSHPSPLSPIFFFNQVSQTLAHELVGTWRYGRYTVSVPVLRDQKEKLLYNSDFSLQLYFSYCSSPQASGDTLQLCRLFVRQSHSCKHNIRNALKGPDGLKDKLIILWWLKVPVTSQNTLFIVVLCLPLVMTIYTNVKQEIGYTMRWRHFGKTCMQTITSLAEVFSLEAVTLV